MAVITFAGPLRSKAGFDDMIGGNAVISRRVRHTVVPTASVLALFATPFEVLPAVGTTSYVKFDGCYIYQDFNAAAYDDNGTEEDPVIQIGGGGAAVSGTADSTLIDGAADFLLFLPVLQDETASILGSVTNMTTNQSFELTVATSEVITGDSDWDVLLLYTLLNVAALEGLS